MRAIPLKFTYRNHRGEVGERRVIPNGLVFGSTQWHPEMQWLLRGFDLDRNDDRDFAIFDIIAFVPSKVEEGGS